MANSETQLSGLPTVTGISRPRPSLLRSETTAAFVSQLLAQRNDLPAQRARRRGTAEGAASAYAEGAQIAVKRMPMGFRKSVTA